MTKIDAASTSTEALNDKSLAWVNLLLSGSMTPADAEALTLWRARSPAHEQAFAEAIRFQRAVRQTIISQRRELAQPSIAPVRLDDVRRNRGLISRRAVLGGAAAACGVGYMAVQPPGRLWPSLAELMSDYHTRSGERRDLAIAAGVALELNTRTNISLRRTGGAPGIELVSGEAAATVQRPAASPFTIAANAGRTAVVSAHIDVRKLGAAVCVTCIEGEAHVEHPDGRVRLSAGRQVTYTDASLGVPMTVDTTVTMAWRRGLLIFRDAPLQNVVDELNRYRPGKIILLNPQLGRRPVYGVFQIPQIATAAEQLRHLTNAKLTSLPGNIVVLS
jgi:transmembrane sensor